MAPAAENPASLPSPDSVTTTLLWDAVTGEKLELLLHGLLEAMGAQQLTWRAGSNSSITTADGGRDLEAVFDRPTPDGDLDRIRWWVEAKGRTGTVPKVEVQSSVINAAGHADVDTLVFCTNSRFSNPTRDWVDEWQRMHSRPQIKLWDRDRLASLVRKYPIVVARVMPEALEDQARLTLLLERFIRLGETPTEVDAIYFWSCQEIVRNHPRSVEAVAMFTYIDVGDDLTVRPWASLLPEDASIWLEALIHAAVWLPAMLFRQTARPVQNDRIIEAAAYLLISVLDRLPASIIHEVLTNPGGSGLPIKGLPGYNNDELGTKWSHDVCVAVLRRAQYELQDVCTADCARVSADPAVFPAQVKGKRYWARFGGELTESNGRIIIERYGISCAVGFDLNAENKCPLVTDCELTLERILELQRVTAFRRDNPDGQFSLHAPDIPEIDELLETMSARMFPSAKDKGSEPDTVGGISDK